MVRMALVWTNQRGESTAEGEAVVMPPSETPQPLSDKGININSLKNNNQKEEKMALTDVKAVFDKMSEVFNANATQGLNVVFQY